MASKTIRIDLEAYALLVHHKHPGESFSEVIKRQLGSRFTAGRFRTLMRSSRLSEDALEHIEAQVRARRHDRAWAVKF